MANNPRVRPDTLYLPLLDMAIGCQKVSFFISSFKLQNACLLAIPNLGLNNEVKEMKDIFKQMEDEVDQCSIHNLEGVDLLSGFHGSNLYTISMDEMIKSSLICLVKSLPKLKYTKDHMCSACQMGKSKKESHPHKPEPMTNEKLQMLHMDLYGPMRVASINEKRYILVIVDDYSRFAWVKFLRTKDEAPEIIIKILKQA
ncbi:retrovirus-related pol polyprotein from transposon TNT 1-94 [Tanacetum coccineum]